MHQSATGATALGMIALLLETHIIVPNSVLIFDEPEPHVYATFYRRTVEAKGLQRIIEFLRSKVLKRFSANK